MVRLDGLAAPRWKYSSKGLPWRRPFAGVASGTGLAEFGAEVVSHVGVGSNDALTMHDGDFELGVCGGLRLFVEEVKGVMVVLLHDIHVFLVEIHAKEAAELVIFGLVVG